MSPTKNKTYWKDKLHEIIYEADTPAGKLFDVVLLVLILASIILVMLESVRNIDAKYHNALYVGEWIITIFFSIEYILRIITVKKPFKYIFSFYGILDLLSTIPMYISFVFAGSHALVTLRALRLLRVFRILKLARYLGASNQLRDSIIASRVKIFVFLFAVLISSVIFGTIMYLVEGEDNGFTNIPKSVYWCIVTLTTVGFGDIAPQTALGQFITTIIMILGYGIIAVPTGIVSAEYSKSLKKSENDTPNPPSKKLNLNTQRCSNCHESYHDDDANFCKVCGNNLH
ncbi:MAG: voltage-gated potassium channel [Olleya marilimosa]|jgi:voltage-gated potassium channel|uniref:Ion transporter n=1 Tax=Olleya marilimosa TaxID=272164 RepID=A0ABR8LVK3_9FLAO|nr:ion transporter [Olleya marilimosa]MBD3862237.1 ion transporter [Olleya marilimosa]MBD3889732.1 ion transporter [Olleya marilimosa]|tara:strand:+ start:338576 stop:339436 length:861 start_codon:yes stop_codon:yes gene_type:complete